VSDAATWSTRATPLAAVAGAVVLTLGAFSIVFAALTLALGGAKWNIPAYACLALTACLVVLRLGREHRRNTFCLSWCPEDAGFRVAGLPGRLDVLRVWQGPGWVTLGLRHQAAAKREWRLVVWKSTIPAPLWSELALRIEAGPLRGKRHQNKENP